MVPSRKSIAVLGSTGSIGQNTLEIVRRFSEKYQVLSLSAGKNLALLRTQIQEFHPLVVSVLEASDARILQEEFKSERIEIMYGSDGNRGCIDVPGIQTVVMGVVGFAAVAPTLHALQSGKRVALANKESLVVAGPLLKKMVAKFGGEIIPVDSEHSAIFQLLSGFDKQSVETIVLTASGGPLFRKPDLSLDKVTPEIAVNHPNWKMGPKISVDSATLMNKALEVVEAHYLFDIPVSKIEVWIHPQSLVHGAVWFRDNSCMAQLNRPDMRLSIGYALSYPDRLPSVISKLSFADMAKMEFFAPDSERFPALRFTRMAHEQSHSHLIALNAANEVAVEAFLNRRILFSDIARVLADILEIHSAVSADTLEAIEEVDRTARLKTEEVLRALPNA